MFFRSIVLTTITIIFHFECYQEESTFEECSLNRIEQTSSTVIDCVEKVYLEISRKIEKLRNTHSKDFSFFQRSFYRLAVKLNDCYAGVDCFSADYIRNPEEVAYFLSSLVYDETKEYRKSNNLTQHHLRLKRDDSVIKEEDLVPDRTAAYKIAASLDCSEAAVKAVYCTMHLSTFPFPWLLEIQKFQERFCSMYEEAFECVNDLLAIACPSETQTVVSPKLTYAYTYYCKQTQVTTTKAEPPVTISENGTLTVIEDPGPMDPAGYVKHAICNQTFVLEGDVDMYLNLTTPDFPNGYPPDIECAVTVKNAGSTVAIFTCETFYLEQTEKGECRGTIDIQRVGRGLCGDAADYVNLQRVILGGIWGTKKQLEVFRFKSGPGSKISAGFVCGVQVKSQMSGCGEHIIVPIKEVVPLRSIPFSWFSYSVIDCHSFIELPEGYTATIDCQNFNAFSLPTCNQSFVQFRSGTVLRVCGFGSGKFDNVVDVIDEEIELMFHNTFYPNITASPSKLTDPFFYDCSLTANDVTVECDGDIYFQERKSCDLSVKSFGYPEPQKQFKKCTIKGKDDLSSTVIVQCMHFELGPGLNATHGQHDFVVGEKQGFFENHLSPSKVKKYILSPLDTVNVLKFQTIKPTSQAVKGFHCLFKYRSEMQGCSDVIKLESKSAGKKKHAGFLTSLKIDFAKDSIVSCQQIVQAPDAGPVIVNCAKFNIPDSPDCQDIYLEIEGEKFCGKNAPKSKTIVSQDGNLFLKFHISKTTADFWKKLEFKEYFYNCTFYQEPDHVDKDDDGEMTVG